MSEWALGGLAFAGTNVSLWLIARKRYSGRVTGTEAERLWKEREAFSREQADEIRQLKAELEHEKLRREFGELKCRAIVHTLRNEVMRWQFLAHPDISEEVRTELLQSQKQHVSELDMEVQRMEKSLKDKGIWP